ncbi:hypothetical protein DH2020_010853 [Rehmannia glutinosa]|uniref:Formin-like protein n=1 Tax=Rehmannia glutinosa TaxID=99300 RepID=A0ABR0XBX3_REHGL
MALFRKLFYRKPPDGLLEICERVYGALFQYVAILSDELFEIMLSCLVISPLEARAFCLEIKHEFRCITYEPLYVHKLVEKKLIFDTLPFIYANAELSPFLLFCANASRIKFYHVVFDCCFTTDAVEEQDYKGYVGGIITELREHYPDASILAFNFREGEIHSQIANALTEYDMTIMEYPRQYEGCPLLPMEVIHHFLRSSESWLSLGLQNLLLMHCERGGWPVLAFMLAALLIYRRHYSGELKTLDMVYKQAPRELLHLLSPLNPIPSQLRYLQYVSRRNVATEWPPLDRALTMDCVIIRTIPNFDGQGGCRPIFRIYGQDPFHVSDRAPKVLFSTPKKSRTVRHYKQMILFLNYRFFSHIVFGYFQAECELVKIDINCHIQGDVVLECICLHDDKEREQMMFRVMFNTAFIRSNILMLNRDEIDILWDAKDLFPRDFRAEVLFSEMDTTASSIVPVESSCFEEKDGLPVEAFAKVQEIFSSVDWLVPKGDAAVEVLQHLTVEAYSHAEKSHANQSLATLDVKTVAKSSTGLTSENQSNFSPKMSPNADPGRKQADPNYEQSEIGAMISSEQTLIHRGDLSPLSSTLSGHQLSIAKSDSNAQQSVMATVVSPLREPDTLHSKTFPSTPATQPTKNADVGPGRLLSIPATFPLTPPLEDKIGVQSGVSPLPLLPLEIPSASTPPLKDDTTIRPSIFHKKVASVGLSKSESPRLTASSTEDVVEAARVATDPPPPPSPLLTHSSSTVDVGKCTTFGSPPSTTTQSKALHVLEATGDGSPPRISSPEIDITLKIAPPTPPPPPLYETPIKESSTSTCGSTSPAPFPPPTSHLKENSASVVGRPLPVTPDLTESLANKPSLSPPLVPPNDSSSVRGAPPPPAPPPPTPPVSHLEEHSASRVVPTPPLTPPSRDNSVCRPAPPCPPPPPPPPEPPKERSSGGGAPLTPPPVTPPLRDTSVARPAPPPPPPEPPKERFSGGEPSPPHSVQVAPPLIPPLTNSSVAKLAPCPPPPPPPERSIGGGPPLPPPPPPSGQSAGPTNSPTLPPPPPPPAPANHLGPTTRSSPSVPSAPPPPLSPREPASLSNSVPSNSSKGSSLSGSPSPPPPSTPPLGKGKSLLSRTVTSRNNQSKKLKPLHWLKISRAVSGSLWAEAQKSGEASRAPEIDISELESLFSAAVPNPDQGRKPGSRASMGHKFEKVQLIEHRRAYNCEIMLSKVKIPLHDMLSSVLALEDSALDVDQVDNLIKFCPTKEEMEVLKGYKGEKDKLGKCEQIRGSAKLKRIMQTILSLGNALNQGTARGSAVGFRLDSLLKLTETRARNNKMTLMHYLCKVLSNKLPELLDFWKDLSSLEPAAKIQLKYLAEEMQAINKGLEKVMQELSMSESDGPVSDHFRKCVGSSRRSFGFMVHVLGKNMMPCIKPSPSIGSCFDYVVTLASDDRWLPEQFWHRGIKNSQLFGDAYCRTDQKAGIGGQALKEFLRFSEGEVRCLASLYAGVGRNVDSLILYFGEDPSRCPFEQGSFNFPTYCAIGVMMFPVLYLQIYVILYMDIFVAVISTLLNFVRMFKQAHEENCKQQEFERKKAEKEASENKKMNASDTGHLLQSQVRSVK